jgi:hypothetical protein
VLGSIQKGVIILLVGLTLVGIGLYSEKAVTAVGALLAAVGLGFLVSAAITHHLSRRWGLIDGTSKN